MPSTLPAGPYRTLSSPEGATFPYYIIPFDKMGVCEGPQTRAHLLANLAGVTDVFVFSHGWNNDWSVASKRYEDFIKGFQALRVKRMLSLPIPFEPLLVGVFWPSQALAWFDNETGPQFAGSGDGGASAAKDDAAASELHASLRDMATELPAERRARFYELSQATTLAKGEDQELASMLASMLAGASDDEAGKASAPAPADLLAAGASFETPEDDVDEIRVATRGGAAGTPAAAGGFGFNLSVLDPRNLLKPFTVYQMKDRSGKIGANGVAPLLADILAKSDASARVHLIGHSFGCKVVMTAACVMPESARPIESALLLQGAVSQYAFAAKVPERDVPGGFHSALSRVRQPILATFSRYDDALSKAFHLSVRRHDDLGELQFAGNESPSKYGALGGFGPQDTKATFVQINDPGAPYDLAHAERIVGVNGSRTISGHGDISNESTWWAEYCLLMAHTTR